MSMPRLLASCLALTTTACSAPAAHASAHAAADTPQAPAKTKTVTVTAGSVASAGAAAGDGTPRVVVVRANGAPAGAEDVQIDVQGMPLDEQVQAALQHAIAQHGVAAARADAPGVPHVFRMRTAEAVANVGGEAAMEEAAFAGVVLDDLAPQTAAQLPIMPGSGLLVVDAAADSPAAKAGMKSMDVIAKVGDQVVINAEQFRVLVRSHKAGETLPVTYYRGGKECTASIVLGSRKQPKLGPGGRIAGAGFEADGDVLVAPNAMFMTMGPNGGPLAPLPGVPGQVVVTNTRTGPRGLAAPTAVGGPAAVSSSVSKQVYRDDHAEITWSTVDGRTTVTVKDLDEGKTVYEDGGAPDAAAMAGMRPELRESVARMLAGRSSIKGDAPAAAPIAPVPPAPPAPKHPGEASQPMPQPTEA